MITLFTHMNRATKLTTQQITEFMVSTSFPLCENISTRNVLEMSQDATLKRRLSTGCSAIDECLRGGFLPYGITEIVGESGAGKTQFAMQLALQVQLPIEEGGLGGKAFYISTEGGVPTQRLLQMAEGFKKKHPSMSKTSLMSGVYIEKVESIDLLYHLLENRLPEFLRKEHIRVVIIDSIAALFRHEYTHSESAQRAKVLWKHSNQLKLLSDGLGITVVVINQVADFFNNVSVAGSTMSGGRVIPALGLTWSNCVNTRVLLSKVKGSVSEVHPPLEEDDQEVTKKRKVTSVGLRRLHVVLASHLANGSCPYAVGVDGIIDVPSDT
eukprot:TRINITY_DN4010_c0_g1_i4.p1 TRINITY_DN4010_c0_g1~~TRINITY_DN4010_c0_g1_i4.p1  ORF type:complete len:326 (-),score=55.44 TRINITY_DN4010_c0_g1_i4:1208-2185(-)